MIKIWGKVIKNEKILKSKTIEVDPTVCSFFDMLRNISQALNIPTPILLDKHVYDFNVFKMCWFKADDFVESVKFDKFILEYINGD